MVSLHDQLAHCGFQILAFPCNQFGAQEPRSNAEINKYAKSVGVKFQMMAKVDVNGPNTSAVWSYLKSHFAGDVKWNFDTKFLIDQNGTVVRRYDRVMTPDLAAHVRALVCDGYSECGPCMP